MSERPTMADRYEIGCSFCGFLSTEKNLASAMQTAKSYLASHPRPDERIHIYDRMAHQGAWVLWEVIDSEKVVAMKLK